ncbi:hypothetical protein Salat_2399400 [Sesamum alatum]|uniref:Uncharacterized protein n=1 Tax=Sesamum alatum TaxID=300844 RepID=A0AAE1XXI8_9LAMI|nr:hypothetical protein Salat_2399400 [Sesamum alatum]
MLLGDTSKYPSTQYSERSLLEARRPPRAAGCAPLRRSEQPPRAGASRSQHLKVAPHLKPPRAGASRSQHLKAAPCLEARRLEILTSSTRCLEKGGLAPQFEASPRAGGDHLSEEARGAHLEWNAAPTPQLKTTLCDPQTILDASLRNLHKHYQHPHHQTLYFLGLEGRGLRRHKYGRADNLGRRKRAVDLAGEGSGAMDLEGEGSIGSGREGGGVGVGGEEGRRGGDGGRYWVRGEGEGGSKVSGEGDGVGARSVRWQGEVGGGDGDDDDDGRAWLLGQGAIQRVVIHWRGRGLWDIERDDWAWRFQSTEKILR